MREEELREGEGVGRGREGERGSGRERKRKGKRGRAGVDREGERVEKEIVGTEGRREEETGEERIAWVERREKGGRQRGGREE